MVMSRHVAARTFLLGLVLSHAPSGHAQTLDRGLVPSDARDMEAARRAPELGSSLPKGQRLLFQPDNLPALQLLTVLDLSSGALELGVAAAPVEDTQLAPWGDAVRDAVLERLKAAGGGMVKRATVLASPPSAAQDTSTFWMDAAITAGVDHIILVRLAVVPGDQPEVEVTLELLDDAGTVLKSETATNVLVAEQRADQPATSPAIKEFQARAWTLAPWEDVTFYLRSGGQVTRKREYGVDLLDENAQPLPMETAASRLDDPGTRARALAHLALAPSVLVGRVLVILAIPGVPLLAGLAGAAVAVPLYFGLVAFGVPNPLSAVGIPITAVLVMVPLAVLVAIAYAAFEAMGRFALERWLVAGVAREHNRRVAAELGLDLESLPERYRPDGWDSDGSL